MPQEDLIVIGGGPAGLMAAATAASQGARTLVLERMDRPGRKLRICGKGRGNIGNTASLNEFLSHFGKNFRFLRPAFNHFFTEHNKQLLTKLGVPTKVERGGRIFPESDNAQDLVDAYIAYAQQQGARIQTNARVQKIIAQKDGFIVSTTTKTYRTCCVLLATGGASYPATGSTGDGYTLAQNLGHTIVTPRPALIPLITGHDVASRLQGLSLRNVSAQLRVQGKKVVSLMGELLFTHFGLSGPIILTLSKEAVHAVDQNKETHVHIDLKPALDPAKLDARLLRDFNTHGKMHLQNLLRGLLPPKLIPICLEQTSLPADKVAHQISASERKKLRLWLKDFSLPITGYRPLREAIITTGGVALNEVHAKTMESKLCPGLFFAGEVLDMDADTGGFNLQGALSTGYLAGLYAAQQPCTKG